MSRPSAGLYHLWYACFTPPAPAAGTAELRGSDGPTPTRGARRPCPPPSESRAPPRSPSRGAGREAEALGVPEEGVQADQPAHGGPCDPGVTAIGQGGELRVNDRLHRV